MRPPCEDAPCCGCCRLPVAEPYDGDLPPGWPDGEGDGYDPEDEDQAAVWGAGRG